MPGVCSAPRAHAPPRCPTNNKLHHFAHLEPLASLAPLNQGLLRALQHGALAWARRDVAQHVAQRICQPPYFIFPASGNMRGPEVSKDFCMHTGQRDACVASLSDCCDSRPREQCACKPCCMRCAAGQICLLRHCFKRVSQRIARSQGRVGRAGQRKVPGINKGRYPDMMYIQLVFAYAAMSEV